MSDKLNRTIARFQAKINNGEFYEAHQTLRTITNRYVKSKNFPEAVNLLYQGSVILSENKEYSSSSDLILYLIEVLGESDIYSKEIKLKLIEMISKLPNNEPSLIEISKKVINLSKVVDESKFGDYDYHNLFGNKFLLASQSENTKEREKIFQLSELHLVLGNLTSLQQYVEFLIKWAKSTNEDPGLFLSRAIINYSYLKNMQYVQQSLKIFVSEFKHDEILEEGDDKIYYYNDFKLLNFLQLLVITLNTNNGTKFLKLYESYKPTLVEYELLAPVEYLGRFYFNLKLGNTNNNNMLANLMNGLFT
ncbi:golgi to ER traffic protein 4 [[Candida] jaroonii]|uniref:Golgi to ER traffic protein 4 n=1 Tax=[Candida] jaroonii TaxID=467808 RepID=A0ACA9YC52_9ASCO|nr:golgi to ER traffic protein 4 [[Candida] jaroonii]